MGEITIQRFTVGYDKRPSYWEYYPDGDVWYPYQEDCCLVFDMDGFANGNINSFSLSVRIYKGVCRNNNPESLDLCKTIHSLELITGFNSYFSKRFHLQEKLPCPEKPGEEDSYTAELRYNKLTLATETFRIVNLTEKPEDLLTPEDFHFKVKPLYPELVFEFTLAFRSRLEFPFNAVLFSYLTSLKKGEKLFVENTYGLPSHDFQCCYIEPGKPVSVKFSFDDDASYDDVSGEPYLFVALAGTIILKIPCREVKSHLRASELKKYIVKSNIHSLLLNEPKLKTGMEYYTHNDHAMPENIHTAMLAPQEFIKMLSFLDKKKEFDDTRSGNGYSGIEMRHHYVFTGKHGVGKETAAKELYTMLKNTSGIEEFVKIEAVDLLDTTNGYSPNLENFLNENSQNLVYIINAEALMMKGAISSLTGMEILANKLKTMKDIVVVLSGKKGQLTELINLNETAREFFYTRFDFEDVKPEKLTEFALKRLTEYGYIVTPQAAEKLTLCFTHAYRLRGNNFSNIYYAYNIVSDSILPHLINRVIDQNLLGSEKMNCVEIEDIPEIEQRDPSKALNKLESLIGLTEVKKSILNHTSLVRLNKLRTEKGLYNKMPPMHMVFTGNPGTGKTTIAEYLGEIYRGIGALSSGHLVETDRSKLVGQYLGETEKNTLNAIERASGGVLFIDEAYNLFVEGQDKRDYGHRVIETLLTYLSLEDTDMIVILAGYTNEMNKLLASNPGLKSRFSYLFHFEDYTPDQLMKIGKKVLEREQYVLTTEAETNLSKYMIHEYDNKDEHFGNGRFITRLLTTHIIPTLSQRLLKLPLEELTFEKLRTIESCDIPLHKQSLFDIAPLDETILMNSLNQLDELVGLENAKKALHNYVTISRLKHKQNCLLPNENCLYWNFIGQTGTGKSTVAEILARILQGLGILKRGHLISLNVEEFINTNNMFEIIENALQRANNGLLFLDLDSPQYKDMVFSSIRFWIETKVREMKLNLAIVFAEAGNENEVLAMNLARRGIVTFNQSIVFNDFSVTELLEIFKRLLGKSYHLDLDPDAETEIYEFISELNENAKNNFIINAGTMRLLAQTVAQIAQLRIAVNEIPINKIVRSDVHNFQWDESVLKYQKIGFRQY